MEPIRDLFLSQIKTLLHATQKPIMYLASANGNTNSIALLIYEINGDGSMENTTITIALNGLPEGLSGQSFSRRFINRDARCVFLY